MGRVAGLRVELPRTVFAFRYRRNFRSITWRFGRSLVTLLCLIDMIAVSPCLHHGLSSSCR